MTWGIELSETAAKQIKRIDKAMQNRILDYLTTRLLASNDPHLLGKALTGNYGGLWRYRVGDWRIVCRIDKPTITVLWVAHRRKVYR